MTITPVNRWPSTAGSTQLQALDKMPGRAKAGEVSTKFESFVLQMFVQEMLPKNASATFGKGFAGETWRSMLAEKLADEIAKNGGIGIAKVIEHSQAVKATALDPQKASPEAVRVLQPAGSMEASSEWATHVQADALDDAWETLTSPVGAGDRTSQTA